VHAHEQATKQGPKIVEFRLVAEEKEIVIDDRGTKLRAMNFNGSIPAPLMVVHEGDYVEVTLVNPETNSMPHNVDFHAATGASGWRAAEQSRFPARTRGYALAAAPASGTRAALLWAW
jgi:nitrite reductase (NO-forming)